MKIKIIFTDGTVLIFNTKGTKKELTERFEIGGEETVMGESKIIGDVEFPSLKLTRKEIVDLSSKIHDLGNHFETFEQWENKVEDILEMYGLFLGEEIEKDLISIVDSEGDEIENFILKVSTYDMKEGVEVVSYNTCF